MNIFPRKNFGLNSIKDQMDILAQNKVTKLFLRISFICIGLSLLSLAINYYRLPPEVPLLYSLPYGESRLVNTWRLWLLPLASLGFTIISMRLAGEEVDKDILLSQIITGASGISSMMSLISMIKVILLVI